MSLLSTIRKIFQNELVAISEPFREANCWVYVFATDEMFERRVFHDKAEAYAHYLSTKAGLSLGATFISVFELPGEVARQMRDAQECAQYMRDW